MALKTIICDFCGEECECTNKSNHWMDYVIQATEEIFVCGQCIETCIEIRNDRKENFKI